MEIEIGKQYVRGDGEITGILKSTAELDDAKLLSNFPFWDPKFLQSYTREGYYLSPEMGDSDQNLVREWLPITGVTLSAFSDVVWA